MLWKELLKSTSRVSPTSINNAGLAHCSRMENEYDETENSMTYYGNIQGQNSNYQVIIKFLNIERDHINGELKKPDIYVNDVQVRCSCPSYRFTGYVGNMRHGAGTGPKFSHFIPNRSGRVGRNPNEQPMICKHIIEFMDYLIHHNYVDGV